MLKRNGNIDLIRLIYKRIEKQYIDVHYKIVIAVFYFGKYSPLNPY